VRFWSQFKSIHKDESISPGKKFQYLFQSTIEGSKAREVINSFPPSQDNYNKAVTYLKERFGKDEVLVEVYERDMLRLVLESTAKKTVKISCLYDKLETQLRALASLGATQEKYAAMLYPLVESCLPEETLRTWERQRHSSAADGGEGVLQKLMLFLRGEVEGGEPIMLAKGSFNSDCDRSKKMKERSKFEENTPTATDLYSGASEKSWKCEFSDKQHNSADCFTAKKIPLEQKKKILSERKACFVCLRKGHLSRACKSNANCQVCGKRHQVISCPEL